MSETNKYLNIGEEEEYNKNSELIFEEPYLNKYKNLNGKEYDNMEKLFEEVHLGGERNRKVKECYRDDKIKYKEEFLKSKKEAKGDKYGIKDNIIKLGGNSNIKRLIPKDGNFYNKIKFEINGRNINEEKKIKNKFYSKGKISNNIRLQENKLNCKGKSVKKKNFIDINKNRNFEQQKKMDLSNISSNYNNNNFSNLSKKNFSNCVNKTNDDIVINDNTLIDNLNVDKENDEIRTIIEIILLLKKFEEELDKKIKKSYISSEIIVEECFLLKKEWLDNFNEIYLDEEIARYIKSYSSVDVLIALIKYNKSYNKKIKESNLKIGENDFINFNLIDIFKSKNIGDIYYQSNFQMINDEIFKMLIKIFQKYNYCKLNMERIYKIKYIINNGNLIFSYDYILSKDNKVKFYYNLFILEKNRNNNIVIQCFENNKRKRNDQFIEYKNKKYLLDEDKQNNIRVIMPLKEDKHKKDLLILIHLFKQIIICRNDLKKEMNLKEFKTKEYYIINKNWINKLTDYFEFSYFLSLIKKNDNFQNFIEFGNKDDEIFLIFKNDEKINNKIKLKNEFIKINKDYLKKESKKFLNDDILFFNNFELFDEETILLIEKFINNKIDSRTQFLFIDKYTIANFENENNILILGKLNKNFIFQANIVFKFIDKTYKDEYIEKIKKGGKNEINIMILKLYNKDIFTFKYYTCQAFNINIEDELKNILDLKKNENVKKSLKIFQENLKLKNMEKGEKFLKNESFGTDGTEITEEFEENKNILKGQKVDDNLIKEIKILISYYFFIQDLEENIQQSSINNDKYNIYDCYLINTNWIEKLKKYYFYDELVQNINQIQLVNNLSKNNRNEIVLNNLSETYFKKILGYNKIGFEQDLENIKNISYSYLLERVKYPSEYTIINLEIYTQIKERYNIKVNGIKSSYVINSKKIILEYKYNSLFELIIGEINLLDSKLVPWFVLNYIDEENLNYHYKIIQNINLKEFMNDKIIENGIIEDNNIVGKFYLFQEKQKNEIGNKANKTNENNQYFNETIIKQNTNNIKFLFKLHFFSKELKFNLENESNTEFKICYLINKELIDKYIDFYQFNLNLNISEENEFKELKKPFGGLAKLLSYGEKQIEIYYNNLISKYPAEFIYKDNCDLNYDLQSNRDLFDVIPTSYENNNLFSYKNYIIFNESFKNIMSKTQFQYTIIDHKIILIFNNNINIGILDNTNNVFMPQSMIYFDTNDDLKKMVEIMKKNGVQYFESNFKNIFENSKNCIGIIKSNKQKENEIRNDFNQNIFSDNKFNDLIKNLSLNQNNNMLGKNIDKKPKKNLKPLEMVLYIMIDSEIIKRKMCKSLSENNENEKYYLLNYEWFKDYIKFNDLTEIIDFIKLNKTIETYLNHEIEENILQNEINVKELIFKLEQENQNLFNNIEYSNNFYNNLSQINPSNSKIITGKYKYITYYKDFLLISTKTKSILCNELSIYNSFYFQYSDIYFGDNKIFMILQLEKNLIEIGELDNNNNIFKTNMILEVYNEHDLNDSINLLLSNGYEKYIQYYLLFNNDYISPIFNRDNNIIGYAYRYNEKINDYTYFINKEKNIKSFIQLYFANYKLNSLFIVNKIQNTELFILSEKYLKEFDNYTSVENEISKVNLNDEINSIMNSGYSLEKFEKVFNVKKFSIIIKKILSNTINNANNNKNTNNIFNIPDLSTFRINNDREMFYYNNFVLIDNSFNKKLEENGIKLFENKYNNLIECYIIDTFILIDVSKNNKSSYNFILEICELKNKNIIPLYLLAYYRKTDFKAHIINILNELQTNFKGFLNTLSFSQGNGIKLENEEKIEIGIIFKLSNEFQNNIQYISPSNTIATNNNNIIINDINVQNTNLNLINNNPSFTANQINNIENNIIENHAFDQIKNDDDKIKPDKLIYQSIKQEFKKPPLIGLKNVGATCYMNATLQCFCNIIKFIDFFKYKLKDEIIQKLESKGNPFLTKDFKYLIENLWQTNGSKYIKSYYNSANSNNKYFIPKSFKEKISEINPLFEGAQANDAKDLVNFLIMTLHEELNKAPKKKDLTNNNLMIDQTNRDLVFQNFVQSFINDNMSLISDLFYAMNVNITECLNCRNRKYNFQIYFFLNFPLEEVRKYKIQEQINNFINTNQNYMYINPTLYQQNLNLFQNNCQKINSVNLDDCFRYNQKMETFSGDNAMYCNNCQMQCNSNYQTLLSTSPEILVLILNRGKGIEFKVKCEFVLQLNLYEYVEMKNTGYMYELIGVVTHMGESGSSGHFIAYCKNPIDNLWYQYNDDLVFPVTNFVNEVVNYAMPYILFYQKINN